MKPIIIVGAGRSGTKMLRGILAAQPGLAAFPREINYIWRHGNVTAPTDVLRPEDASPAVKRYIRRRFDRFSAARGGVRVVEKTCANSLRIPFVRKVFPEARVIHIVRDGRAVAESARRNWLRPQSPRYLLEKARWVPVTDIPYYALRFMRFQLDRLRFEDRRSSSWGPRFEGMEEVVDTHSLIEVCAIQWRECVTRARDGLADMANSVGMEVRYEDLVTDAPRVMRNVFEWLELDMHPDIAGHVDREIHTGNLDKWRHRLSEEEVAQLMPHIEQTLTELEYIPTRKSQK